MDVLVRVARTGRRDADRVRAATTLLNRAYRGLEEAETLHGAGEGRESRDLAPGDVVRILGARLQQIDRSGLPAAEKARLTGAISDSLLRAYSVDVLDKRLEALQAVLLGRKEQARRDKSDKRRAG